jgi:hypothetical protein
MPELIYFCAGGGCYGLITERADIGIEGIRVTAEEYGADCGRVRGNAGGGPAVLIKVELFFAKTIMTGIRPVIILRPAVSIGDTSADDRYVDIFASQIRLYLLQVVDVRGLKCQRLNGGSSTALLPVIFGGCCAGRRTDHTGKKYCQKYFPGNAMHPITPEKALKPDNRKTSTSGQQMIKAALLLASFSFKHSYYQKQRHFSSKLSLKAS